MAKKTTSKQNMATRAEAPSKEYTVRFAKIQTSPVSKADSSLQGWLREQKQPEVKDNPEIRVKAAPLTAAALAQLQAVVDSENGPQKMLELKLTEASFVGILYSALTAHSFMKMQGDYVKQQPDSRNAVTKEQWKGVIGEVLNAYSVAGLKVTESELNGYVKLLTAKASILNAVTRLANSGVEQGAPATKATAKFIPAIQVLPSVTPILTKVPACNQTFQGTFTRHFAYTYSWVITISFPCGLTGFPPKVKWCSKSVTLATVTVSLNLNVGYKIVNCCSATVWGAVTGQVCVGSRCLTCTAAVAGVAIISKTASGSSCNYALGIQASLVCKIAGFTICSLSYPFGWNVYGPCPPLPC